ncbi:Protein grpE [Desulfovibrio sp. X2]|nr:Protein grpE [Desulfovibrio sp. X2]
MSEHEKEMAPEAPETAESAENAEAQSPEEAFREALRRAEDEKLRALAELENAKRRLEREKDEFRKYATETVLSDLVPVLDNLELALAHGRGNEACKDLVIGVEMTVKLFLDSLARHGLEQVGAVGDEFDPAWAEAVGVTADSGLEDNHVAAILQRGYKLNGRVIRPAKVMIAKNA